MDDEGTSWREKDLELGEAIVYLDNASIINALTLLAYPEKADPYKLLDLESFCEAFLLYDAVRTLTGSSFMSAVGGSHRRNRDDGSSVDTSEAMSALQRTLKLMSRQEASTPELYGALIDAKLLRPKVLRAGSVHYYLDHLEEFDAIARALDFDQIVAKTAAVFGEHVPWDVVVRGEETWTSDSYPIYYFPRSVSDQRMLEKGADNWYWDLNHNRRTEWLDVFVSQTFSYVVQASRERRTYLCSAVRLPVVSATVDQLDRQFNSFVQGTLAALDRETSRKLTEIEEFMGRGGMEALSLPALGYVLNKSGSRDGFLPTLFQLREEEEVKNFRAWCRKSDQAWRSQDIDGVYLAVREIGKAVEALARSASTESTPTTIARVPDPMVLVDRAPASIEDLGREILGATYNPSLVFLKDCSNSPGIERAALEKLLGRELADEEATEYQEIYKWRQKLYSTGKLPESNRGARVERIEVTMGDRFENVNNSIIATRGSIAKGIVTVRERGDGEIADVLVELEKLISDLSSVDLEDREREEAFELLQGITEATAKPKPSGTNIRAMGASLLSILGTVAPIAEAAKSAVESLSMLLG